MLARPLGPAVPVREGRHRHEGPPAQAGDECRRTPPRPRPRPTCTEAATARTSGPPAHPCTRPTRTALVTTTSHKPLHGALWALNPQSAPLRTPPYARGRHCRHADRADAPSRVPGYPMPNGKIPAAAGGWSSSGPPSYDAAIARRPVSPHSPRPRHQYGICNTGTGGPPIRPVPGMRDPHRTPAKRPHTAPAHPPGTIPSRKTGDATRLPGSLAWAAPCRTLMHRQHRQPGR